MKFKIVTLGCKVNAYESEVIKEDLLKNNYIEDLSNPDIVIINTCSVTNMADNKSKKTIRREKREYPNAILVVCGCSSQNHQEELNDLDIDILLGNKDKNNIVSLIKEYLDNKNKIIRFYNMKKVTFEDMCVERFDDQTRGYIKIQDGCNNYCSYCIIPYLRGNIRSKDMDLVLKESRLLVKNGHKEIVLTGIDTGSYGKDKNYTLTDLIINMSLINGLERIRLSSVEITQLTDEFLELIKDNKVLCDHLHIPLQAGSNHILKLMNRKYDLDYFFDKIKRIREINPMISITTDVIVGFPNETEGDFNDTIKNCKKLKFSKIHVFPYSKRSGTVASKMEKQVPDNIKKIRARELISLSNDLELDYNKKFINKEVLVLVEENINNSSIGHTTNYLKVSINGNLKRNRIYKVLIKDVTSEMCYGVIDGEEHVAN